MLARVYCCLLRQFSAIFSDRGKVMSTVYFSANSFQGVRGVLLLLMVVLLASCAGRDHDFEYDGAFDPLEPVNRNIYGINKKLDFFILRPAAVIYNTGVPDVGKSTISNVLDNLGEPRNIVNHILQNRGDDAVRSSARFVYNTVFGLGGIFDVADRMGVQENKNDFGTTIRAYTGNDGAYLMLPLLGPSSIADAPGTIGDSLLSPAGYVDAAEVSQSVAGFTALQTRSELLEHEDLLETAFDEYSYLRDFREEYRRQQVPPAEELWGHPSEFWNIRDR